MRQMGDVVIYYYFAIFSVDADVWRCRCNRGTTAAAAGIDTRLRTANIDTDN